LAVDPPVYQKVRGPQQPTEVHNTLLLGGQGQRPVCGQWFKTLEEFRNNLHGGRQLETGVILFWKEAGGWAAVAAEFAQAYSPGQIQSCVRQLLFVRPATVVVVDQLTAPTNQAVPEVQWLLQVPREPVVENSGFRASTAKVAPLSAASGRRIRSHRPTDTGEYASGQFGLRRRRLVGDGPFDHCVPTIPQFTLLTAASYFSSSTRTLAVTAGSGDTRGF